MARKVAVVDDDREVCEWIGASLLAEGYEVKVAPNGLRLVSTLHVDRPDLILLDVVMDIPVVFMSGKSSPADVERGMACGAVDYFPKPLDMERLLARVRELVGPAT
jgi:DNA-binding response OmpR family regulator